MSKKSRPPTLLSTFNVQEKQKLEQEPEDVNAPPMSSGAEDEEDDELPSATDLKARSSRSKKEAYAESDDSESERSSRGNIKRTSFPSSSTAKSREKTTRKTKGGEGKQSMAEVIEEASSSSSKRMRVSSESENDSPNHFGLTVFERITEFTNKERFVKLPSSRPCVNLLAGNGNGPNRKIIAKGHEDEDDLLNSSPSQDKPTFKPVASESLSPKKPESKKRRLAVPADDMGTPEKEVKPTIILPSGKHSGSGQDKKGRSISASQESTFSNRGVFKPPHPSLIGKRPRKKKERSPTPEYKPAMFVNPVDIDSDFVLEGGNVDSVSSPILSDLDQLSDTGSIEILPEDEQSLEEIVTKCPWCGDTVSEQALQDYSKGKRLNVRMQTRFCAKHKKETAMDTWRERGYPHIDWSRLEKRLEDHQEYLANIVDGKKSYYRDMLAEKIQTGQARSLKKEGDLNPGYYGPRGCKVMCDYLVEEFGELLKEKATKDRVIAGRGSAAFIQSVLVAELAVQLIIEDMDVSAGKAREIMEESKALDLPLP
ncbi:hypothetical protein FLONG3_5882 [Fusarium longipes]|uniref:Restriction of telomere capping protein 4 n=1 Tax=Fusarium longipes TaxID=694270 RepID=A0A395SRB8_9HYPO|nr:hypothetical protein FLONG3_5882 [Fusarium longipes]